MSLLPGTPAMDRVLDLLPTHVLRRDAETGGLLAALLAAVGGELDLLERDIDALYASWFIETCPEWVVPYLADLVGVVDLPPLLPGVTTRRAFVANTARYRQGKGTPAVAEQVARDATGWPASVVEYHRVLAMSTAVNHVRLDRPATATIRTPVELAGPLELVAPEVAQGALHRVAHTVEVRRIASGRGRFGIPNLAAFLFPHQVVDLGWAPARRPDTADDGWSVHPLGAATPLFAAPEVEPGIEHLAQEADLPVPLRPRRLLALLTAAREVEAEGAQAAPLPVGVRIEGEELSAERLRVNRLEDLAHQAPGVPLDGWQAMVDALTGRVHPFRDGARAEPDTLEVRHAYGDTADVGAGGYDRRIVHDEVLADDPYRGDPARGGPDVTAQRAVIAGSVPLGENGPDPELGTAFETFESVWDSTESPAGSTCVISIGDNAHYPTDPALPADLAVSIPQATRLVVVAATWMPRVLGAGEIGEPVPGVHDAVGLRPVLRGDLTVTGDGGSSLILDGLVIEGDVVVMPGAMGSVTLSQCTIGGTIRVAEDEASNPGIVLRVVRSRCSAIRFGPAAASLELRESIVDAEGPSAPGGGSDAVRGAALHLMLEGSTVVGRVLVRTLAGSNAILDGRVVVENRQTGCLRYSYAPRASRVPRRYRCSPTPTADPATRPVYVSREPGSPSYLALAPGCPGEIAQGGEGGAEMGVHHHLGRPLRVRAAARLLAPYLPVALEFGVRAPVPTDGQQG